MSYYYYDKSLQNRLPSNMDCMLVKSRHIEGRSTLLAVVCDGFGSYENGMYASATAIKMLRGWFATITNADNIGMKMKDAVLKINSCIISQTKQSNINTASTLSALLLIEDVFYIAHVGDSRVYSYDGKMLTLLTNDDVSESGTLTACMGQKEDVVIQYYEGMATGKTFIVCSDGLYKRMDMNFMASRIKISNRRLFKESAKILAQHVVEHGEQDNISIALVKVKKGRKKVG